VTLARGGPPPPGASRQNFLNGLPLAAGPAAPGGQVRPPAPPRAHTRVREIPPRVPSLPRGYDSALKRTEMVTMDEKQVALLRQKLVALNYVGESRGG